MPDNDRLFDSDFLSKLERLSIVARRAYPGMMKGEKRSPRRGTSVEFADFRNYAPGDDFRHVDWNVYGRLEKLFLKLFMEEEDLHVYVLFDASKSMDFGEPKKVDFARRLAGALGYVALTALDRVGMAAFSDRLHQVFPTCRGRHNAHRMLEFLSKAEVGGRTDLNRSLSEWALRSRRPGVAFVVSDFFDEADFERGFMALLSNRYEVNVIHVLDDFELNPDIRGDLRLVDVETQAQREVTVSGSMLASYRRSLEEFCGRLQSFCHSHRMGYVRTSTSMPFEDLVLRQFRRSMFVG